MIQSAFDDLKRMNKRQVKPGDISVMILCFWGTGIFRFLYRRDLLVFVSDAEFWDDSVIGTDDMEGLDGRDWK